MQIHNQTNNFMVLEDYESRLIREVKKRTPIFCLLLILYIVIAAGTYESRIDAINIKYLLFCGIAAVTIFQVYLTHAYVRKIKTYNGTYIGTNNKVNLGNRTNPPIPNTYEVHLIKINNTTHVYCGNIAGNFSVGDLMKMEIDSKGKIISIGVR